MLTCECEYIYMYIYLYYIKKKMYINYNALVFCFTVTEHILAADKAP